MSDEERIQRIRHLALWGEQTVSLVDLGWLLDRLAKVEDERDAIAGARDAYREQLTERGAEVLDLQCRLRAADERLTEVEAERDETHQAFDACFADMQAKQKRAENAEAERDGALVRLEEASAAWDRQVLEQQEALRDAHDYGRRTSQRAEQVEAERDAATKRAESAEMRLEACQEQMTEVLGEFRQVCEIIGGSDFEKPGIDLAQEARLALDLHEATERKLIAERDAALGKLEVARQALEEIQKTLTGNWWGEFGGSMMLSDISVLTDAALARLEAERDK